MLCNCSPSRYLATIITSIKQTLVSEQKRSDFKVEESDAAMKLDVTPVSSDVANIFMYA